MTREDIISIARESGIVFDDRAAPFYERFAAIVGAKAAAAERNKLAAWMMAQGFATGHGDTMEDLLAELDWQVKERVGAERDACAKVCEDLIEQRFGKHLSFDMIAAAIRARGQA